MKNTLVMNMKLENGKTTTISMTEPKADLTEAEVKAVAAEIVAKEAFVVGGSAVTALDKSFIRTMEEKPLP